MESLQPERRMESSTLDDTAARLGHLVVDSPAARYSGATASRAPPTGTAPVGPEPTFMKDPIYRIPWSPAPTTTVVLPIQMDGNCETKRAAIARSTTRQRYALVNKRNENYADKSNQFFVDALDRLEFGDIVNKVYVVVGSYGLDRLAVVSMSNLHGGKGLTTVPLLPRAVISIRALPLLILAANHGNVPEAEPSDRVRQQNALIQGVIVHFLEQLRGGREQLTVPSLRVQSTIRIRTGDDDYSCISADNPNDVGPCNGANVFPQLSRARGVAPVTNRGFDRGVATPRVLVRKKKKKKKKKRVPRGTGSVSGGAAPPSLDQAARISRRRVTGARPRTGDQAFYEEPIAPGSAKR
jgi:hypothetical protein